MGWFLTRKKGKGKTAGRSKSRSSAAGAPAPWDPAKMLLSLRILAICAALVGGAIGWHYGERWLRQYTTQRHAAAVNPGGVTLVSLPVWMGQITRQELTARAAERVSSDPLDGPGLRAAAEHFGQSPWVREVRQFRRLAGGKLIVDAEYRMPVAVIGPSAGGYHLVDREGVRLPGIYSDFQLADLALPLLMDVQAGPPTVGMVWQGGDVQAGLEILGLFAGDPYGSHITAVSLGQRDARGRLRLVLHTTLGLTFHWGFAPGQDRAQHEPSTERKLEIVRQEIARQMVAHPNAVPGSFGTQDIRRNRIIEIYGPTPRAIVPESSIPMQVNHQSRR